MSVLVVAEHLRGRVRDVTYELVTAARELGGPVEVAVIAPNPAAIDVACEGFDTLIHVPVAQEEFESEVYQRALEALIEDRSPEAILLGFTVNSMGYAAAVAAKQRLGFASDVFGLSRSGNAIVATRAFYGSKVHGEVEFPDGRPVLLLLRPATWPPAAGSCSPTVTELALGPIASRARHLEFREPPAADVDITTADFLLAIGRGVGERENVVMFEELAEKLGATVASSRPLVDAGWMPSFPAGWPIGEDRQAEGLPRLRNLWRGPPSDGHESERHDHRRELRSGGRHLQCCPLRRCGRPVRRRRRAGEADVIKRTTKSQVSTGRPPTARFCRPRRQACWLERYGLGVKEGFR